MGGSGPGTDRAMKRITILGDEVQSGAYLLRLYVKEEKRVRFGRFQGGRPILVPQGELLYIGSAMARKGSMTLARRLLRHATRCNAKRPQVIRRSMLESFKEVGLGTAELDAPRHKKLFWNIDYLLEEEVVELSHVLILRTRVEMEDRLAHFLTGEPNSSILAPGLGAHDKRGSTHILVTQELANWWQFLPQRLEVLLGQAEEIGD